MSEDKRFEPLRALKPDELRCLRAEDLAEGDLPVGGYSVRYDQRHVDGYFFTAETDFGPSRGDNVDTSFHHHAPILDERLSLRAAQELADHVFAPARATSDEIGIWTETVLRLSDEYEAQVAELVKAGKIGWSPGSSGHTARTRDAETGRIGYWGEFPPGEIVRFPIIEHALTPTPADFTSKALPLRIVGEAPRRHTDTSTVDINININHTEPDAMAEEKEGQQDNAQPAQPAQVDLDAIRGIFAEETAKSEKRFKDELKRVTDGLRDELAPVREAGRDAGGTFAVTDSSFRKYDNASTVELAMLVDTLASAPKAQVSPEAYRALAFRMESEETIKDRNLNQAHRAFRQFCASRGWAKLKEVDVQDIAIAAQRAQYAWKNDKAWRANELMGSTATDKGDEWIGVGYSNQLWDDIYHDTLVLQRLNPMEWPWPGAESGVMPIVDSDVTFYKVAQTTDLSASPGGIPTGKTTESTVNTGQTTHALVKLGARTVWSGELTEDAMLPFVATLRDNLTRAGGEYLESAIIDGDTDATTSTNINDIAGTPAATDYFLAFDGFRKLGLITNTANSTSLSTLGATDFTAVRKLLGTGGARGLDPNRFSYICDTNTYYEALGLTEVKTIDVFGPQATIRAGTLASIHGSELLPSAHMHLVGSYTQSKKADTAGKIDQDTAGDNTTGAIVAVIWDLWKFFWRRRMTIETQRWAYADSSDIVLHMRASLKHRDNDAAAIGYNVVLT